MAVQCFNSPFPTDLFSTQKACYAVRRFCVYLTITKPRSNLTRIKFTFEEKSLDGCQQKPVRSQPIENPIKVKDTTGLSITRNTGNTDDPSTSTEGSTFEASLTFPQLGTSYIKVDLYKLCKPKCCIDKVVSDPNGRLGSKFSLSFDYEWENPNYSAWQSFLSDLSKQAGKLGEFFSNFLKGNANFTGLEINDISKLIPKKFRYGFSEEYPDNFVEDFYSSDLRRRCDILAAALSCDKANEVCGDCVPVTPDPRFSTFVDQSTL